MPRLQPPAACCSPLLHAAAPLLQVLPRLGGPVDDEAALWHLTGTTETDLLHSEWQGANHSLRTTHSLLTAHHSPLTTHYSPFTTHYSLLTTHCALLTTHCALLTTHCSLLTTHYSLLTTHDSPSPLTTQVEAALNADSAGDDGLAGPVSL